MPSVLSVSYAYSISRRLPSVSGKGIEANMPNRPGWSVRSLAAYSFASRESLRPRGTSPSHTPGLINEVTEVAIPLLSMSSSDFCTDHGACPRMRALSCAR